MTTTDVDISERLGRYLVPPPQRTVEVSTWVLRAAQHEIEMLRREREELRELLHRRAERREVARVAEQLNKKLATQYEREKVYGSTD